MHFHNSCHVMVIISFSQSKLVILIKKECCYELSLILLKSVSEGRIETKSKVLVATKGGLFSQLKNILFSRKPILRFGPASFVFIFVVLGFLAAIRPSYFRTKYRLRIHFYNFIGLWFYFDFFLNLGIITLLCNTDIVTLNRQHISRRKNPCYVVLYICRHYPQDPHQ